MPAAKIKIGTLGSPATFAGEATRQMRELHPEFSDPVYFPSMDDCWSELRRGTVDAVILGVERTGQPHHGYPVIQYGFHVIAQLAQPLNCNLYVKPNTRKDSIRRITGHGSIHQCTAYLDKNFPGIPREAHGLNSVEAAKAVIAGDGTMAVVGSRSLPTVVSGLEVMASNIDDGAIARWWAVSAKPVLSEHPAFLVITGRFGPEGQLGDLIGDVTKIGYRLQAVASFAVNTGVSIYDYVLMLNGKGSRPEVEKAVSRFADARLAGAFD
jgi:prephenate dehydratase